MPIRIIRDSCHYWQLSQIAGIPRSERVDNCLMNVSTGIPRISSGGSNERSISPVLLVVTITTISIGEELTEHTFDDSITYGKSCNSPTIRTSCRRVNRHILDG